ncbi:MAG: hypothetical protein Unbinned838contig1000_29 [Prokaryotic dsDNA virus sp.]|nr:MAG: hypothetical protein Unbinned838contig1000_29 [Prokaryotic dsDNA virus sp.]|tara:strand:+ start:7385 stop:8410 length:1026 start_codon:yes stop_codon:yes gene_type:complete
MKRIGEYVFDWISTFRNYVYLKKLDASTSTDAVVVEPDGKLGTGTMGTVGGTGTGDTVAKWINPTTLGDSEITDTGSVVKIGSDATAQETLYINTDNRTVGFRTQTPGSAMDVNGTLRARNELNIGVTTEQNFFVEGGSGPRYVKMGAYTNAANFLGMELEENLLKTTAGFGKNGKVVQASRIYTTKVVGSTAATDPSGWPTGAGLANGIAITPTPGPNQVMYIRSILVNKLGTVGSGWSSGSYPIQFGWRASGGANADRIIGGIPRQVVICSNPLDWWYQVTLDAEKHGTPMLGPVTNKPLLLSTPSVINAVKQPDMYFQVEYTLVNVVNLRTNVDQTLT